MLKIFKPEALITLPRSGSTWLSNCIFPKKHRTGKTWEVFNPTNNNSFFGIIGGNRDWWHLLETLSEKNKSKLIEYMNKKNVKYVKECWGVSKIDFFNKHFKCSTLTRKTEYTMPGISNPSVNFNAYIAYHAALTISRNYFTDYQKAIDFMYHEANGLTERICGAHAIMECMLVRESKKRNIPVFEYEKIVVYNFNDLKKYLKMNDKIIQKIIETRNPRLDSSPFEKLGVGDFISGLRKTLPKSNISKTDTD